MAHQGRLDHGNASLREVARCDVAGEEQLIEAKIMGGFLQAGDRLGIGAGIDEARTA